MGAHRWLVFVVVFATACGQPSDAPDSSADALPDSADAGAFTPLPPLPPALPVFDSCPAGWSALDGTPGCIPWKLGASERCAVYEAHFPGRAGCVRLGSECPADGWPLDAPADAIFVRAAAIGGDGTRDTPFGTFAEALVGASSGDVIAIGAGSYDEAIDLPAGVTLLGACVEDTVLRASGERFDRGVVTVMGAGASVRNLRIGESEQAGVWVVGEGRSVTITDVAIEGVRIAGIDAEQNAEVTAERVAIRSVRPIARGIFGRGATIEVGAQATLREVVIEDCREFGLLSYGDGTLVTLEDVAVLRTGPLPNGDAGPGLTTLMGGRIEGRRVVVDRATDAGIVLSTGEIRLVDAVIRGTRSRPIEMDHGRGVNVEGGAAFACERCVVTDTRELALVGDGDGTRMILSDLVVLRTSSNESAGVFGRGLTVQAGAQVEADRLLIADTRESAVLVGGMRPATAAFSDLTVLRTRPSERAGRGGNGVTVQAGSRLTLERAEIFDSFGHGVLVGGDTTTEISDIRIEGVSPLPGVAKAGRGMVAQQGGALTVERAFVRDVWDIGVGAVGIGSTVALEDCVVSTIRRNLCESAFCMSAPGGHGLVAYGGARLTARSFVARDAEVCGVHMATQGVISLSDGEVRDNAIGACLQSELQRIEDLQENVRYVDNDISLDTTMLPIPMTPDLEVDSP